MALLHPRPKVKLRATLTIGCTMARGRPGWCQGLCEPVDGLGACGRIAPHALLSRFQQVILESRDGDKSA